MSNVERKRLGRIFNIVAGTIPAKSSTVRPGLLDSRLKIRIVKQPGSITQDAGEGTSLNEDDLEMLIKKFLNREFSSLVFSYDLTNHHCHVIVEAAMIFGRTILRTSNILIFLETNVFDDIARPTAPFVPPLLGDCLWAVAGIVACG